MTKTRWWFVGLCVLFSCEANWQHAESKAREYARSNFPGYEIVHLACEHYDSDQNQRVRCNLSVRDPETRRIETPAIECPSNHSGCISGGTMCQVPKGD